MLQLDRLYDARVAFEIEGDSAAVTFNRPVFLVLEEAHKFAPAPRTGMSSISRPILERIAAEGRKFGVFMLLASQRPSKVDADVLSMCNSQIILRIINQNDQTTIGATSEALAQDLLEDLPGLGVGEAVIVGSIVPAPLAVMIQRRKTRHGGADIDVVAQLAQATQDAEEENSTAKELTEDLGSMI